MQALFAYIHAVSASFESAILRNDEIRHVFDQVEGVITACGEHSQTDAVDGAADSQLAGETYGVRVGLDVVDEFVFRLDASAHRFSADMSGSAAVAGSAVGPAASRGAGGDVSGSTSGSTPQWVKFHHMPSSV